MNYTSGNRFIFFLLFVSTLCFVTLSSNCVLVQQWTVFVTNNVSDDIVIHVTGDKDLGNQTIPSGGVYQWTFCQKVIGTRYDGHFWWGSRYQTLALVDRELIMRCRTKFAGHDHCYWLVESDGFYVSARNNTFPDGWVRKKSWPWAIHTRLCVYKSMYSSVDNKYNEVIHNCHLLVCQMLFLILIWFYLQYFVFLFRFYIPKNRQSLNYTKPHIWIFTYFIIKLLLMDFICYE